MTYPERFCAGVRNRTISNSLPDRFREAICRLTLVWLLLSGSVFYYARDASQCDHILCF